MSSRKQNELNAVCSAEASVCCLNCFDVIDLLSERFFQVWPRKKEKRIVKIFGCSLLTAFSLLSQMLLCAT